MSLRPADWHKRFVQQASWTRNLRNYLLKQVGLKSTDRLIEIGCGTGAVLGTINQQEFQFLAGLDINPDSLKIAQYYAPIAEYIISDAHAVPIDTDVFDICFCHFFLLWIIEPQKVIKEMMRITKPGGYVLLLSEPDYGGRIDFPAELSELGEIQIESLREQGADPFIGRKITEILISGGLQGVQTGIIGAQWDIPQEHVEVELEQKILDYDLNFVEPPANLKDLLVSDAKAWSSGSRILYIPTFYSWGQVL